ncbi:YktB family protein [Pseudalkalibacillus decolorationis]|uniref:YktB family protein n=1 Tax=Pseudalkalibacillus decolorationis TaxID=163879 RepID=UPI002148E579|nr:DUF1054 domain-containing protein [Pseudalkalibacillus decolorationis]
MTFQGLTDKDFDVFKIDGLEQRMEAIKSTIRPKLEYFGEHFAPLLTAATGDEMFHHTAKHARRSVNPPNDTWVAFANSKRGYKMLPHFQIGLYETHLFVWFAIIYESPIKQQFSTTLEKNQNEILKSIPDNYVWSIDHTKPDIISHEEVKNGEFTKIVHRLRDVKKAEILCGIQIQRNESVLKSPNQLLSRIEQAFQTLAPLYQLAQQSAVSTNAID